MPAPLYTFRLAGGTSAWDGISATGFQAYKTLTMWDDGSLSFVTAAGKTRKIPDTPDLNALLQELAQGTAGIPVGKKMHT